MELTAQDSMYNFSHLLTRVWQKEGLMIPCVLGNPKYIDNTTELIKTMHSESLSTNHI